MANRRTRRNKNKKGGNHDVFKDTPFELGSSESLTGGRKRKSGKNKKGGLDSSLAALGLLGTLLAIGSGKGKSRRSKRPSKRPSKRRSNRRR